MPFFDRPKALLSSSVLLLGSAGAWADDASQVLLVSMNYRTLAGSVQLAPTLRQQVSNLQEEAMLASQLGRHADALRHLFHGMALMRGGRWSPQEELATSLVLKLDHTVWEPAQRVRLRVEPLFEPRSKCKLNARAMVQMPNSTYRQLGWWSGVDKTWSSTIQVPDLAPGVYRLEVRLESTNSSIASSTMVKSVNVIVSPGLRQQVQLVRNRLARLRGPAGAALWTAQYMPQLFDRVDSGDLEPARIDFSREVTDTNEILNALESDSNPFAWKTGDMRWAYRSEVDASLQPYRLYVPRSYDRKRAYPLIIALHGMGGDENTLFDYYGDGALIREAERQGYIVACPKGREPASMYRGAAEQDVMDVVYQVTQAYRIDPERMYLLGHSMGGFGAWSIAINHPNLFAALASVAGGGNPAEVGRIRHIPQMIIHGANDRTVPPMSSKLMADAVKASGARCRYLEVPSGGHNDVFVPALPEMFSWFNMHRKGRTLADPSGY